MQATMLPSSSRVDGRNYFFLGPRETALVKVTAFLTSANLNVACLARVLRRPGQSSDADRERERERTPDARALRTARPRG